MDFVEVPREPSNAVNQPVLLEPMDLEKPIFWKPSISLVEGNFSIYKPLGKRMLVSNLTT